MTFFVTNLMRHVLIMFDTRVTQAAPAMAGGPLSPGQPGRATRIRPDINCFILSDQLIFEDLLTQTHEEQETSAVSRVSRVWRVESHQAGGGREGSPLSLDLSQITFHQNYRNPPPFVSRL